MPNLDTLWEKGKRFLGVENPIMAGAMTWISESGLVSAVSNAGAFGCLAGGNMDPNILDSEIKLTQKLTKNPFAVNLVTIAPNYKKQLNIVLENQVPFIIFAAGIPKISEIKLAKESGAKVMCFAANESIAEKMIDRGVDGLMLEGSEAGGHIGHVSLSILLQQVLFNVHPEVPVFVAGGIGSGRFIPYLLLMGAAGVQLGTAFVATEECKAHPKFKEAFLRARAREAVATPQVGSELHVVAVRALKNKGMDEFANLQMELIEKRRKGEITQEKAQFEVEKFWMGALRRAVQDGDVAGGSMMAGQSVGLINGILPLQQLLDNLISEAKQELEIIHQRMQCP